MYNYDWDRLKTWLYQYDAIDENIKSADEIIRLDLSGHALKSIPESFHILTKLIVLNLSNNQLNDLPDSLADLSSLNNLDIRRNNFVALPDVIGKLSLRSLNASGNKITDISVLKNCPELRVLDLRSNQLVDISNSFPKESELINLNLSSNYIKDIENVFTHLGDLNRLNVSANLLTTIPSSISDLGEIEEIDFSDNQIEQIDEAFFDLDVEDVNLSINNLTVLKLHALESLEKLTLDENDFKSLTISEDFAPYLIELSCDSCSLKEFLLPASNALEQLCYSSNEIKSIPDEIEKYNKLLQLEIDGNEIVDLPDTLANLVYLQTFYAEGNPLNEHAKKVVAVLSPNICDLNMKSGITIEKATADNLKEMAELLSVLFEIETDFVYDFDKQLEGLTDLFEDDKSDLLVAIYENEVVGMMTMQRLISSAAGGYIGQMEDLVVKKEYRKMGVGSRLINKMRSIAQEYKYKRIQLAADIENDNALRFYNRRGFNKTHLNIYHYIV